MDRAALVRKKVIDVTGQWLLPGDVICPHQLSCNLRLLTLIGTKNLHNFVKRTSMGKTGWLRSAELSWFGNANRLTIIEPRNALKHDVD